jgi:hypothetical protein
MYNDLLQKKERILKFRQDQFEPNCKLFPVKLIIHGNQTTGKNATVNRRQLRKSVTTTKSEFVKCRAKESCDELISTRTKKNHQSIGILF